MNQRNDRPWSVAVRLDEVPELGRHVELEAGAEVRAALAKPVSVDAIERLSASFDLVRQGRDGLHVSGRVQATVRQTCVVTLDPVVNTIDEAVEVDYAPPGELKKAAEPVDLEEGEAAQSSPDEPEPLIGNSVDLGLLATEFLVLGVDPYPRKPDAAFEPPAAPDDPAAHPFAALASLSKKGTVKE
jgi:Large ribosomal RNA subunit accumulation protein YceD